MVSWDGQLSYIINPVYRVKIVREDDRELDTATGAEAQEPSSVDRVEDTVSPGGLPQQLLVQVFDRRGRLVRWMASDLFEVSYAAVSPDRRLYLVGTPSALSEEEAEERQGHLLPMSVEVYDREGRRDEMVERRIKEAMRSVVRQYSGKDWWVRGLDVDRGGIVYLRVTIIVEPEGSDGSIQEEVILGWLWTEPSGSWGFFRELEGEVPAGVDRQNGRLLTYRYLSEKVTVETAGEREIELYPLASVLVREYTRSGELVREYERPAGEASETERSLCFTNREFDRTDGRGHVYVLATERRRWSQRLIPDPREADNEYLDLAGGDVLVEYDAEGRFVGVRTRRIVVPDYECLGLEEEKLWDVDMQGNVYAVEFLPDRLAMWVSYPVRRADR